MLPAPQIDAHDAAPWRDKLALLLECTGEGIYGIDLAGRCIFINRAGAAMLGYTPEQVLGRNMHQLIHHARADGGCYAVEECPIFRAFQRGQPCRVDSDVLWRADGGSFPAEYSSYPIVEQGEIKGAVVTFVDISERKRAEELLRQAHERLEQRVAERTGALSRALAQLRELSAHLLSVREAERTRIAREIHDELGSLLVALKLDAGWLRGRLADRPELAAKCQQMRKLIDGAVENVGRIITDLRPSILDHQGLFAALEWQIEEFADTSDLVCDTQVDIAPDAVEPDGGCATAVFRIFQEILSNIARHAHARFVRIRVRARREQIEIEVADDGRGAPCEALDAPNAYGVMGMRERARHFGGTLVIAGMPGAGTCVHLAMPLGQPFAVEAGDASHIAV